MSRSRNADADPRAARDAAQRHPPREHAARHASGRHRDARARRASITGPQRSTSWWTSSSRACSTISAWSTRSCRGGGSASEERATAPRHRADLRHARSGAADVRHALAGVELILHAGDVGGDDILDELELIAPMRAVYGNTDPPGEPSLASDRDDDGGCDPCQPRPRTGRPDARTSCSHATRPMSLCTATRTSS